MPPPCFICFCWGNCTHYVFGTLMCTFSNVSTGQLQGYNVWATRTVSCQHGQPVFSLCHQDNMLVSEQIKDLLEHCFISSPRKLHSTVTAIKVVNIVENLDGKNIMYWPFLWFVIGILYSNDNHGILCQSLSDIGLSDQTVDWFSNYFSKWKQCVQCVPSSSIPYITWGVPQVTIYRPMLFAIYICACMWVKISKHLYICWHCILYCCASSLALAFEHLLMFVSKWKQRYKLFILIACDHYFIIFEHRNCWKFVLQ